MKTHTKTMTKQRGSRIYIVALRCLSGLFWMYLLSYYYIYPVSSTISSSLYHLFYNDIYHFTFTKEEIYFAAFITWCIRKIVLNWEYMTGKIETKGE